MLHCLHILFAPIVSQHVSSSFAHLEKWTFCSFLCVKKLKSSQTEWTVSEQQFLCFATNSWKPRLWLGHSNMRICFDVNCFTLALAGCFGLLSVWKMNLHRKFSAATALFISWLPCVHLHPSFLRPTSIQHDAATTVFQWGWCFHCDALSVWHLDQKVQFLSDLSTLLIINMFAVSPHGLCEHQMGLLWLSSCIKASFCRMND